MNKEKLIKEASKIISPRKLSEYADCSAVWSALLTNMWNIYTWINIDTCCSLGFCAEHSAISEMLKAGESEISEIVAVCREWILPPCGRCRELMAQVNLNNLDVTHVHLEDETLVLKELLPHNWMKHNA